ARWTRRRRSPSRSCRRAASSPRARAARAFPARAWPARACAGGCSFGVSFQDDVVDQAGAADADRGGEDARLEVGDLDVVDGDAVEELAGALRVSGRELAGERHRALPLLRREEPVPRRAREPVLLPP